MVRVTYSWVEGKYALFIDGRPISVWSTTPTKNARFANQWQNINLMAHTSGASPERDGYMRNVIVSKEPASIFVNPKRRFSFLGHSFSVTYTNQNTVNVDNYDVTVATALRKYAVARGYDLDIGAFGVGGGYWIPALSANQIRTHIPAALAFRPDILVLYGPTNDVSSPLYTTANFETEIKTDLGTIAAHAAMPGISKILFLNTPSRCGTSVDWNDTTKNNIISANAAIASLKSWWDATYPAYAGRLVPVDLFNAWGGMIPANSVMVGQRSGSLNNLHPSCYGSDIIAEVVARQAI